MQKSARPPRRLSRTRSPRNPSAIVSIRFPHLCLSASSMSSIPESSAAQIPTYYSHITRLTLYVRFFHDSILVDWYQGWHRIFLSDTSVSILFFLSATVLICATLSFLSFSMHRLWFRLSLRHIGTVLVLLLFLARVLLCHLLPINISRFLFYSFSMPCTMRLNTNRAVWVTW
jgi:hypothetical protein